MSHTRKIGHAEARDIATRWGNQQDSIVAAFVSTGSLSADLPPAGDCEPGERLLCAFLTADRHSVATTGEGRADLDVLAEYIRERDLNEDWGPVPNWR